MTIVTYKLQSTLEKNWTLPYSFYFLPSHTNILTHLHITQQWLYYSYYLSLNYYPSSAFLNFLELSDPSIIEEIRRWTTCSNSKILVSLLTGRSPWTTSVLPKTGSRLDRSTISPDDCRIFSGDWNTMVYVHDILRYTTRFKI